MPPAAPGGKRCVRGKQTTHETKTQNHFHAHPDTDLADGTLRPLGWAAAFVVSALAISANSAASRAARSTIRELSTESA
eukprot:2281715-Rhodomonas_salina.1